MLFKDTPIYSISRFNLSAAASFLSWNDDIAFLSCVIVFLLFLSMELAKKKPLRKEKLLFVFSSFAFHLLSKYNQHFGEFFN